MKTDDLLLEIGFEEMPAAFLPSAVEQLRDRAAAMLEELGLSPAGDDGPIRVYATPRRLALLCTGIPGKQEDRATEVRGPSRAAAFDSEGKFTRAATGFAHAQGVRPEDLLVRETPAGEYVFAVRVDKGRTAAEVLAEAIPSLVLKIEFPRSMRWGSGDHSWARPIRWVAALLGSEVLEFELAGVKSGRLTYGHRVLGPGPFEIPEPGRYASILRKAGVIVDQDERRESIRRQVEEVAANEGGAAAIDPALLEQVNYLVEYPTAFVGRFSEDYLEIPPEVLVTTMQRHQRYFPVYAARKGGDSSSAARLLPLFVGVRNGSAQDIDQVRTGNERVIRARLADASFFFKEDQRTRLEHRLDLLKRVLFQESMGTLYDKTERLRVLARRIAEMAGIAEPQLSIIDRAALLCKADLTTGMVREFPELQGIMGREYAKRQGEDPEVCLAISEHYMPAQAKGELPATTTGAVLSLADKIDTICGCLLAGITPTGSQDPYALRRQGAGIISILAGDAGKDMRVPLGAAVEAAIGLLKEKVKVAGGAPVTTGDVLEFLKGRLRGYLEDHGIRYDVIDAVLEAGFDDVGAAVKRARALQAFSFEAGFQRMMIGFKRAANLARQAESLAVNEGLLAEEEEKALHDRFKSIRTEAERLLREEDYAGFFRCMAQLKEPVDDFLDRVLVMSEDLDVRRNRLALLSNVAGLFGRAADLSRLVIAG